MKRDRCTWFRPRARWLRPRRRCDAQGNTLSFFITSANPGKGADLGGHRGCRCALRRAREGGGRAGESRLARVYSSTDKRAREGSHRRRTVVQRQGRAGGGQRRRSAQRQQQVVEGELAERKRRGQQRPRRQAEPHDILTGSNLDGTAAPQRAATGPTAPRAAAAPRSATTIARAAARIRRRGTRRTPPPGVRSKSCARSAAKATSTASQRSKATGVARTSREDPLWRESHGDLRAGPDRHLLDRHHPAQLRRARRSGVERVQQERQPRARARRPDQPAAHRHRPVPAADQGSARRRDRAPAAAPPGGAGVRIAARRSPSSASPTNAATSSSRSRNLRRPTSSIASSSRPTSSPTPTSC